MKTWEWIALAAAAGAGYLFLRAYSGAGLPAWLTGATTTPAPAMHPPPPTAGVVNGINALIHPPPQDPINRPPGGYTCAGCK